MKKYCVLMLSLIASHSWAASSALSVDEVKENLSSNGVRAMDWYTKGDTQFAESKNTIGKTEVAINKNKAYAAIQMKDQKDYELALSTCMQLADLIPHEKPVGWVTKKDDIPYDTQIINSTFSPELKPNQKIDNELNGWKLKIERGFDTINCSVVKQ